MDKIAQRNNLILVLYILLFVFGGFLCCVLMLTPDEYTEDLGDYYTYHGGIENEIPGPMITGPLNIPDDVIAFSHDEKYIVALQKWNGKYMESVIITGCSYYDVMQKLKQSPDSLCYWIIDKQNKFTSGPLYRDEYIDYCQKRNVPPALMKSVLDIDVAGYSYP